MDKQRFKFGKNWKQFLTTLNEERIHKAEDPQGQVFIDTQRISTREHQFAM